MVPHAPLLLPELGGSKGAALAESVAALDLAGADVLVLASPHGVATGVYRSPSGDLDAFGPRGLSAAATQDNEFAEALSRAWGRPLLEVGADHGVVVPLRLLAPSAPVVAVAFAEGMDPDDAVAEGAALADALSSVGGSFTFVASANLSAGLTDRSPLPSLEGAAEADASVVGALRENPAALMELAPALAAAGSCAAPTLAAFGSLFAGRSCDVLAYDHPFGVGHVVARTPVTR